MAGYKDNNEIPGLAEYGAPSKNLSFLLLAPPLLGLFLLITGIAAHGYIRIGLGVLLLGVTPFTARFFWRNYFDE
jgi:hypothetical protein